MLSNCEKRLEIERAGAGAACSLETWVILCRGSSGAKASARAAGPEWRALETDASRLNRQELDKLLRYEAMINRQLNHAIAELERVQARRKGRGASAYP